MDVSAGLRDVVALESDISRVDGEKGILEYRGYNIHDLAEHSSYEETVYLLWYGELPSKKELEEFSDDLAERRELPPEIIGLLSTLPKITHPMVVLRTAVSYLGSLNRNLHVINPEENLEKSKNILAKIPTITAYYDRITEGKGLIHPDKSMGHAENFLHMLWGRKPNKVEADAIDLDLVLHAEHTLNPSTFSARISASTLSDMYAGVVSATGDLFGPLHGGAAQGVMEMLRDVEGKNIQKWIDEKLERGERIMGFGHRVYKVIDPRAIELKKLAEELDEVEGNNWCSISDEIVKAVQNRKKLYPNVDFYTASVYANLGIPDDLFISIFAISRIAGWTTHIMDQYRDNKLIRPLQRYVGEMDKEYILLEKR